MFFHHNLIGYIVGTGIVLSTHALRNNKVYKRLDILSKFLIVCFFLLFMLLWDVYKENEHASNSFSMYFIVIGAWLADRIVCINKYLWDSSHPTDFSTKAGTPNRLNHCLSCGSTRIGGQYCPVCGSRIA